MVAKEKAISMVRVGSVQSKQWANWVGKILVAHNMVIRSGQPADKKTRWVRN